MIQTLELIRFSHTLFALPFALASMVLAAQGFPSVRVFLLIVGCMVCARTSAMAFNRFADADIDAKNPRTKSRHIPAGIFSRRYVFCLTIISGAIFIGLTYFLNSLAFALAPIALLITWFYSYTKRFTHWAQLYLGLAIALSPIGAWIAVQGHLDWPPILLGVAVLFWVAGFDIFYASQDHEVDSELQLKSIVVKYGIAKALTLARLFHFLTATLLLLLLPAFPNPWIYGFTCAVVIAVLLYEHSLVKAHDLSKVDQAFFTLNGWVGLMFFIGTSAAVYLS